MAVTPTLGTLALGTLAIAPRQPAPCSGPVASSPGTTEYQRRQQQLQNARSRANPGVQNPFATGVAVEGIQRQNTGTGSTAAGAPVAVDPGTTGISRAPGIGAPMR